MSLIKMWSYGEVLLPLPDTSRRIDIRDGSPPSDQVKYVQKCGGLDLANGSSLLWRNDDNKLELMQFHPQEQGLNESVTIAFPRNVQVLPSVALYESGKNVLMVVASQASIHLVTLTPLTEHHSLLSDLTASDFKRACFSFKSSIPVTFCDTIIHDNKGLLFFSSKISSPTVICLSSSSSQAPETLELKSTGLLGRLWNSNSEANRSKAVHFGVTNGQLTMLSITADNQLRIWSSTGECLFTAVLEELVDYEGDLEMKVKNSESELVIFVKAGGNIFKYRLTDDKKQPLMLMQDFGAPNNGLISNFNCESDNIWIVMKEETENGSHTSVKAFDDFRVVDLSPSQSPEEYVECKPHEEIPRMVLQRSTIMPSALRRALAGKAFDTVPEHITQKYVQNFLTNEARHEGVSQEEYFAEFYDTVLEYNERALAITGVVGGQNGKVMILRRNAVGFIRPLTQVEAICAGLESESSGLDITEEAGDVLSSLIPVFNEIVANSDVMELVSFRLRNGEAPLAVAKELRDEIAALIAESHRKEDLEYQIRNMADQLSKKTSEDQMGNVFTAVFGELVRLIEIPDFSEELDLEPSAANAHESHKYHLLASTTRSIGSNLFTLAQLGLVLVDNLVAKYNYGELVSISEAFSAIISNLVTLDWVSSARSVTKARANRSEMNFTSSRLGETFSSFSMNGSTTGIFESAVPSESQLLEAWLAMGGIHQADAILSSPNIEALGLEENNLLGRVFAIIRLLSISNERMSLPVFLLETGQYDLLKKWVLLNKYVTSDRISVVNYFEGICMMQDDAVDEAVHHFLTAATNLYTQDFFTKYLLKDLPNSNQSILTTSLFLHVAEKFKENTSFCRQILEVAIERVDQEDDRQSQLWNKVFTLRLQDEDYTGAYRAMISNTDIDSQKNCLRTFVLHLSDSGDFGPLVNSEYSGLESEIAPILENRALAVSPEDTRYFDLLFAFMSVRENYRGAARAMYLQSQHIASGYESLEQLETRESALLTAINSLYLVKKEDQWVATASANGHPLPVKSPKRTHEGGMRVPLSKDTVVTSLDDMENECLLVQARLALKMEDIDTAGLDATEIATLMAKRGMYHEAGNLLKSFKEPADVAVKILASTYACNISRPEAEGLEMQLIDLMEEFEAGANSTRLYYIASEEILKIGQMLPSIMLENYREREPTELIRQMAKYGELDEAVDGACFILEKAQTLLERKKSLENFWLPSMLIEQLNSFTKIHNHELHELLQTRMDRFLQTLENSVRQNVNVAN